MKTQNWKIKRTSDGRELVVKRSVVRLLVRPDSNYESLGPTDEPRTFAGITATGEPIER